MLSNIGNNRVNRGEYAQAIPLLKSSIEKMLKYNDFAFASGRAVDLVNAYLETGNLKEAGYWMDFANANHFKPSSPRNTHLFYEAKCKYYLAVGNQALSRVYMDSMLITKQQHDEQFNAMVLLRMEQKESAKNQQAFEREKERNRHYFLFALCGCALLALALGFYIFYSRAITRKNKGLYLQIKEQDRLRETYEAGNIQKETPEKATSGTKHQQKLVLQLREYLLKDKNYLNSDINRDEIITALATNKTYLYDALNVVADKSLQEYIYLLRLEEARRMLDGVSKFTLETVATDCGFNTYRHFSRLFHKQYLISPSAYRKIATGAGR